MLNWLDFVDLSSLYLFKLKSQSTGNSAQFLKKLFLVKIATLLNFAGKKAITDFNTFQFAESGEKIKLDKVLEEFERYWNPTNNVVFERH